MTIAGNVSIIRYIPHGGETGSTGIKKLKWHTEVPSARKTGGDKVDADDYAYALAA